MRAALHLQPHVLRAAVARGVGQAFLGDAIDVLRGRPRHLGEIAFDVEMEGGLRRALHVPAGDQLRQAGFQPQLLDLLRAQAGEGAAQGPGHPLGGREDRARILGEIGALGPRFHLDHGGERADRGQALAELVVEIPRQRPPLLLLHLEQAVGEGHALRRRLREPRREIVDRAGDLG